MESLSKHAPATLIVGVSGDLLEVARELGRQGERVGLLSRNAQLLYRYKERLEGWGVKCEAFVADVTESQGVLNAMMSFSAWSPRLDRLIYNVGVLSTENAATVTESELSRVMEQIFSAL
jgi:short-subunit dehydrogenase